MSPEYPSTSGPRHFIAACLALGYGAFLALVVFWPTPVNRPVQGQLNGLIELLHQRGVPSFVDYEFIEFSANVMLFVPVGLVLGLLFPRRWWPLVLVLGPAMSVVIELTQGALYAERTASAWDVVANSIGATIGVLLAVVLRAVVADRDRRVIACYEAERAAAPVVE